jgi:hypothetical protein
MAATELSFEVNGGTSVNMCSVKDLITMANPHDTVAALGLNPSCADPFLLHNTIHKKLTNQLSSSNLVTTRRPPERVALVIPRNFACSIGRASDSLCINLQSLFFFDKKRCIDRRACRIQGGDVDYDEAEVARMGDAVQIKEKLLARNGEYKEGKHI